MQGPRDEVLRALDAIRRDADAIEWGERATMIQAITDKLLLDWSKVFDKPPVNVLTACQMKGALDTLRVLFAPALLPGQIAELKAVTLRCETWIQGWARDRVGEGVDFDQAIRIDPPDEPSKPDTRTN